MFGMLNDWVTFIVSENLETEIQKQDEDSILKNFQGIFFSISSNSKGRRLCKVILGITFSSLGPQGQLSYYNHLRSVSVCHSS